MNEIAKKIYLEILKWPNVKEGVSAFGSRPAFFVGKSEFAHFHSDSQLDVRFPFKEATGDRRVEPNPHSDLWLFFNLGNGEDGDDAEVAVSLAKKAYDKATGEIKNGKYSYE